MLTADDERKLEERAVRERLRHLRDDAQILRARIRNTAHAGSRVRDRATQAAAKKIEEVIALLRKAERGC